MLVASMPQAGAAGKGFSFIRDAEIENTIRFFAKPVFQAAGLPPSSIKVHIVDDNTLNAFVAGGLNMFFNTGFLMRADSPLQVIGVIAHETGHISGGHLVRSQDAMANATAQTILGYVLGGAAMVAGQGELGSAVISGAGELGKRSFLQYSRTQESAADQAAVKFMDAAGINSKGFLEFMEILGDQELVPQKYQDPYVRSHPMTRDRINFIANHVQNSSLKEAVLPGIFLELHQRMQAKLNGYLRPLGQVLHRYPESDTSIAARYARAVAYHRASDMNNALKEMDALLSERPNDPFFLEFKGQVLFENSRLKEALEPYKQAADLLGDSPLVLVSYGRVLLELNENDEDLELATSLFSRAVRAEPESPFNWRQLAIAYGKLGKMALSSLAMAEEAYRQNRFKDAKYLAQRAEHEFEEGSREKLHAQDIITAADRALATIEQKK